VLTVRGLLQLVSRFHRCGCPDPIPNSQCAFLSISRPSPQIVVPIFVVGDPFFEPQQELLLLLGRKVAFLSVATQTSHFISPLFVAGISIVFHSQVPSCLYGGRRGFTIADLCYRCLCQSSRFPSFLFGRYCQHFICLLSIVLPMQVDDRTAGCFM